MDARRLLLLLAVAVPLAAQTPCPATPAYSPCEMVFELAAEEAAAHPNPYSSVQLQAEFRSPRHRTFLMPAFWDGGRRMVIRFAPIEPGEWVYRLTSNIAAFDGKTGTLHRADSKRRPASCRPPTSTTGRRDRETTSRTCGWATPATASPPSTDACSTSWSNARAAEVQPPARPACSAPEDAAKVFPAPDRPDPGVLPAARRSASCTMNRKGIVVDLILAGDENHLAKLFPTWQQRERYIRYLVARYAPMNITWQGVQEFEEYPGRPRAAEGDRAAAQEDRPVRSSALHPHPGDLIAAGAATAG